MDPNVLTGPVVASRDLSSPKAGINQKSYSLVFEDEESGGTRTIKLDLEADGNTVADPLGNTWLHVAAALGDESLVKGSTISKIRFRY